MSDKTFKERVREEAADFSDIYADFYEDFKARRSEGSVENAWHHLFAVPFNGLELVEPDEGAARQQLKVKHKHQIVLEAIEELGVHKLRLGSLTFKNIEDYLRVSAALDTGLLTPDDVVPPSGEGLNEFDGLAQRMMSDPGDPFFWRSLLEILCRAFVASRGRRPWPLHQTIDLAFDLDDIRQTLPKRRWNKRAVLKALRKPPYAAKYPRTGSAAALEGVGEDRIQEITDLIGPMDDEAIFVRLRNLFPDAFERVWDARIRSEALREHGITEIMKWAEICRCPSEEPPSNDKTPSENDG